MSGIPYVIETEGDKERSYDLYSRMLKDRIVFLNGEFGDGMANSIIAQLLFLESQDRTEDIRIYINSPGGGVSAMYAIFDVMQYIECDVATIGYGSVCSAGSFILAAGTKGKRYALPNTDIMIHELSTGASGKFHEVENNFEHVKSRWSKMAKNYSAMTGNAVSKIKKDMKIDNWFTAEEAKSYGLIDSVEYKRK